MLKLDVPAMELYDERKEIFIVTKPETIQLEHSLLSIHKWESAWEKPFLTEVPKTDEETADYIRCMTITQNVDPNIYVCLPNECIERVSNYINAAMTATWFREEKNPPKGKETVTAELIYYWMILYHIPFECQKWHLNKLLTLIRVCNVKNTSSKKMSRREMLAQRRALNSTRKAKLNTRG